MFFKKNIKVNWEINYEIKSTETNKLEVKLNGNFLLLILKKYIIMKG